MNQRAHYLIEILDKIGTPLLKAAEQSNNGADTATTVASLLGKVVETSISMNQTLDLTPTDAQDDSLRVALAALAGSLVADQYKQKGKVPEAADLSRIQSAMSAVLTFGDNFALSDAHIQRLQTLKANGGVVDAHQISIQYVDALIPVINAVGAFPFGQPEQKLIMDVSDRLVKRTAEMRETLLPGLSGDDEKLAELAILRASAEIYAACHEAETAKLMSVDGDAPAAHSIDPVWIAFEMRTAILESVVKNLMPNSPAVPASASSAAPVTAAVATAPAAPPPAASVSGAPEAPAAAPVAQEAPSPTQPPAPPDAGAKPAIFQSKPAETPPAQDAQIQPPVTPQVQPPPASVPPAQTETVANVEISPPPAAPVAPPAVQPPTEQVAPLPETQAPAAAQNTGGGPMGFFAKKDDGASAPADNSVSPPLAQPEAPPPVAPPPEAPLAQPAAPPPAEQAQAPEQPIQQPPPQPVKQQPTAAPPPQDTVQAQQPPATAQQPPATVAGENAGEESTDGGDSSGNPMSFFGKKE
ncbi:MAG: hypothetical protein AB8B83_01605 [Bdellovibrionales bacterium]